MNEVEMTNLLNIFSLMPELKKQTKPQNKFNLQNEQTLAEKDRKILEDEFNEKDLNEFMTNNTKTVVADLNKAGKKYSNFYAIDAGKTYSSISRLFYLLYLLTLN